MYTVLRDSHNRILLYRYGYSGECDWYSFLNKHWYATATAKLKEEVRVPDTLLKLLGVIGEHS